MQIMLKARKNERKNKLFLTQSVIFKSQPLQIKLKFSDAFDSLVWTNVWRFKHFLCYLWVCILCDGFIGFMVQYMVLLQILETKYALFQEQDLE